MEFSGNLSSLLGIAASPTPVTAYLILTGGSYTFYDWFDHPRTYFMLALSLMTSRLSRG
jgi:hypothetical protein